MSKKRSKTPAASRKTAKKTEAPKKLSREEAAAPVVETACGVGMSVEPSVEMSLAPAMAVETSEPAMAVEMAEPAMAVEMAEPAMAVAMPEPAMSEPAMAVAMPSEAMMSSEPMSQPTTTQPMPQPVDRKQIARLAFSKFAARGYVHGFHVQDWLEAEAELLGRR